MAAGGLASSRPSRPSTGRAGSRRSRHQVTSLLSPNVHTMAMPVPLAGSARRCASTGTSTPNSGLRDGTGTVVDGPVQGGPVHRQPEPPPDLLEGLLVQVGEPVAQFGEIAAGDGHLLAAVAGRRGEPRVVGQRRIAP